VIRQRICVSRGAGFGQERATGFCALVVTLKKFLLLAGQWVTAVLGAGGGEFLVKNVQQSPSVEADVFPPVPAGRRDALKTG
jgi:hypothetical protein